MSFPYSISSNPTGYGPRAIQIELKHNQLDVGVDGQFGTATADAVKVFQAHRSLTVDGVVGPITARALLAKRRDELHKDIPIERWILRGIIAQESGFDFGAVGFAHEADKGLVQINLDAPPPGVGNVTEAQAFDPSFSLPACAEYIHGRLEKYFTQRGDPVLAEKAAVCAWHAPRYGDEWASTGSPPNPDAELYYQRVSDKGHAA